MSSYTRIPKYRIAQPRIIDYLDNSDGYKTVNQIHEHLVKERGLDISKLTLRKAINCLMEDTDQIICLESHKGNVYWTLTGNNRRNAEYADTETRHDEAFAEAFEVFDELGINCDRDYRDLTIDVADLPKLITILKQATTK